MNTVFITGNLTRDTEYREFGSGSGVATLNVAVSREFKNKDGEKETDFFTVKAFGKLAELCYTYCKKGNKIAVQGRVENRSYEDKDGTKKYITEIMANSIEFLSPKSGEPEVKRDRVQLEEINDSTLPF